jgi:hypothetical protein
MKMGFSARNEFLTPGEIACLTEGALLNARVIGLTTPPEAALIGVLEATIGPSGP